jgi:hypothetical protein
MPPVSPPVAAVPPSPPAYEYLLCDTEDDEAENAHSSFWDNISPLAYLDRKPERAPAPILCSWHNQRVCCALL